MNVAFNGVIQRKLALMDKHLSEMEQRLRGVSADAFAQDWGLRLMTERALQVAAEIDPAIVHRIATGHLDDFRRFRDCVDRAAQ